MSNTLQATLAGPAAKVLTACRLIAAKTPKTALLLHGAPGVGKTAVCDALAIELTGGTAAAIEHVNGQSLTVERVRQWRNQAAYGNLFSDWTVKRIDELDLASAAAKAELLTYLDYLPEKYAVLATTNEYDSLRAASRGRLETRFRAIEVGAPTVETAAAHLMERFGFDADTAAAVAANAVPYGETPAAGVNMRQAILDAETAAILMTA